ncbi:MAG: proline--tRNA ligase [Candidatus Nanoarchaeia archaeon]
MADKLMGITVKKEADFSEWYTQVLQKAELIEYSDVSGCYILRPRAYYIWERIQEYLDKKFKKTGVKNSAFPLLIPEHLLIKESKHIEGFAPEVAWVTEAGNSKLSERLAIRPTSETIMYDAYAKWIKSYKDLPLKLNQWCSVLRWEFKHPTPFLRAREFHWQEGHTVFATKKEADKEAKQILTFYEQCYKEVLGIASLPGTKSEKERFAGADYSLSLETFLPNGKAVQACTSHHLGQNFSTSFNISFLDSDGKSKHPFQNCWGLSTRSIGVMIAVHSDDKGLVLPPNVAENKVVIVPIFQEDNKEKILKKSKELQKQLKSFNTLLDEREGYTPGWKYNEWELKGIPLRIEFGPKDLEKNQAVVVRRDTGKKEFIALKDLKKTVDKTLKLMQQELYQKSETLLQQSIKKISSWEEFQTVLKEKQIALSPWCGKEQCETDMKNKTEGAKSLTIPFKQESVKTNCFHCQQPAKIHAYFGRSY